MGGQDGFSRDMLSYNIDNNVLMGGINIKPSDTFKLGLNLTWTKSEAALDPFDLPADDYVAITPTMFYDFSRSHTYSDLDTTRVDAEVTAKWKLGDAFWLYGAWRYADFQDDAPYMYDTTGSVSFYTLAAGWSF
ncbi:MAG: hypothetical protein GY906_08015 [bacterium]|nr:hypothetical protein [bacterium]